MFSFSVCWFSLLRLSVETPGISSIHLPVFLTFFEVEHKNTQVIDELLRVMHMMKSSDPKHNGEKVNTGSNKYATLYKTIRQLLVDSDPLGFDAAFLRNDMKRLDEVRRCISQCWMDYHKDHRYISEEATDDESVAWKWYTFLCQSRMQLVQQLGRRISASSAPPQRRIYACRTFWGLMAGTPQYINVATKNEETLRTVDAQLLLHWVRAVASPTDPSSGSQNLSSDWLFHDDASLLKLVHMECVAPYRDVQYYLLSAIRTIANELYNSLNSSDPHSVHRLIELLMMIPPIPMTQKEFDTLNPQYIIPLPLKSLTRPNARTLLRNKGANEDLEDAKDDMSEENDRDTEALSEDEVDDDSSEENEEDWNNASQSHLSYTMVKKHQSMCGKAWLAVLRLMAPSRTTVADLSPFEESILKQSLQFVPKHVLPVISFPLRFADFFHMAYSFGNTNPPTHNSVIPLLALEGLYYLMTQHGLEFKNFYKQLYALIQSPSIFYVKYRVSFLRLMDKCLTRNDMLPTHVVAAFTKRLLRNALYASPSSIIFILTFVSNLLRKHPEMSSLIHRAVKGDTNGSVDATGLVDRFNAETNDPEEANALQSSLWELNALEKHYYSGIATLAASVGCEKYESTVPYDTANEFVSITYTTLFEQERSRKRKSNPSKRPKDDDFRKHKTSTPLAFHEPTTLFTSNDVFGKILAIPSI
jgi:U3 small nucleolar RNA-associated protein 19